MMRISLDGLWRAAIDPMHRALAEGWAQTGVSMPYQVSVPGCLQRVSALADAYPPRNGLRNSYKGTWILETELNLPDFVGKRVRLIIEGAAPLCHLYINGVYASGHEYSVCPWVTDITRLARAGANRVTVAVTEDEPLLYAGSRIFGLDWSGVYGHVYAQIGADVAFEGVYLTDAGVEGIARNDGDAPFIGEIACAVCGQAARTRVSLSPGAESPFVLPVDTQALPHWNADDPLLFDITLTADGESATVRTGYRRIQAKNGRILVNGVPVYLAGAGEEYESPEISPLANETLIRRRFEALKAHGFNFYRYHTHVPSETELNLADEMGIFVDAELGLVSNFNKTLPVEKALSMLPEYVRATRRHPSLLVYCLGNEGSQLMVESAVERNKARIGCETIKQNTQNQFAICCFGSQGELPELDNDIETPHLWSDHFMVAYDGLTRVPWAEFAETTLNRPCVLHEYGKFGVWPDMADERLTNESGGMLRDYADQAREALREHGMEIMEAAFIRNSRLGAAVLTRTILEEARRQPYLCGSILWSFFRGGPRNTGLCDDTGMRIDGDPSIYRNGSNAPVALLMDRAFQGRAIDCHVPQTVGITLSNFSRYPVEGDLIARLLCEGRIIAETTIYTRAAQGETREALRFAFSVPADCHGKRLRLLANMAQAENAWDFWAFDPARDGGAPLIYIKDDEIEAQLFAVCPRAVRLQDADSIRIGCRSWTHPMLAQTALRLGRMVVSDVYDDVVREILAGGGRVLLLDTDRLPAAWYQPGVMPELGARDPGRFYSSFRAGWSSGNLLTVIEDGALPKDFPGDSFCDLCFYAAIQSARGLCAEAVAKDTGLETCNEVYAVAKIPYRCKKKAVVQDPNAIAEQDTASARNFDFQIQGYLIRSGRLTLTSLKLLRDSAGKALLRGLTGVQA